jgi:ribosomal-protein-alanine N-acetyltransferase
MNVRPIAPSDINEVLKIEYECFKYPYPPSLINFLYANFRESFLVAVVDDIAGYVIGISDDVEGHIISIGVREGYRNLGVGKELMDHILDVFNGRNLSYVRLEVREGNTKAIRFYYRLGFRRREVLRNYYEDGENAYVLVKRLK